MCSYTFRTPWVIVYLWKLTGRISSCCFTTWEYERKCSPTCAKGESYNISCLILSYFRNINLWLRDKMCCIFGGSLDIGYHTCYSFRKKGGKGFYMLFPILYKYSGWRIKNMLRKLVHSFYFPFHCKYLICYLELLTSFCHFSSYLYR